MSFIEKIVNFFKKFFTTPEEGNSGNELSIEELEAMAEDLEKESNPKERIKIARRTWLNKLYTLEQCTTVFENDFPNEYQNFMQQIEGLRQEYEKAWENVSEATLTFDIDPEESYEISGKIKLLEGEIKKFIETEVKFSNLSKSLQRLILKLNILYNTSIYHSREEDKKKAFLQAERALNSETKLIDDFRECHYIRNDVQLKERIINLLSYIDYQIFKTCIRNSDFTPEDLIKKCAMVDEFEGFDYNTAFLDFAKDEISDLSELFTSLSDETYVKIFKKKSSALLMQLTYSKDIENQILNTKFWNDFMDFESSLLEMLYTNGVDKDTAKVSILKKMNVSVNEDDVLVLPKTYAFLSLTMLYSKTHDEKILILIKLLKNISDNITYKEIYFLLVLFDIIEIIETTPNDLIKHMKKYIEKYSYSLETIRNKKMQVHASSNKDYVAAFPVNDEHAESIIATLNRLNIDFGVDNGVLYINSFYFNALENVYTSLQNYTQNII